MVNRSTHLDIRVSQKFGNVKQNLVALDAFVKVMKVTNHTGLRYRACLKTEFKSDFKKNGYCLAILAQDMLYKWHPHNETRLWDYSKSIPLCKYTWVSQKFCNILVVCEVQFDSSGCFCQDRESDKPSWTVRCQTCLIF